MRTMSLTVFVAVLCVGVWMIPAQAQQEQQTDQGAKVSEPAMPSGDTTHEPSMHQPGMHDSGMGSHQVIAPALIQSPNEMQVQGKVLNHKNIDVTNDKEHRLLRLQTKNGQIMEVDLGRKDRLPQGYDIRDGQWVIVTGVQGRLENNNVLVAHNVANVFNFTAEGAQPGGGTGGTTGKESTPSRDTSKESTNDKDTGGSQY